MSDWDEALEQLDAGVARQIRQAVSRAGLQAHDPAAKLIAEMWVAVASLRAERMQLGQQVDGLSQGVEKLTRLNRLLLALVGLQLLMFVGWMLW